MAEDVAKLALTDGDEMPTLCVIEDPENHKEIDVTPPTAASPTSPRTLPAASCDSTAIDCSMFHMGMFRYPRYMHKDERGSPRNTYRNYSHYNLSEAYKAVKEGRMSTTKAAKIFNIPASTLRDRIVGKYDITQIRIRSGPKLKKSKVKETGESSEGLVGKTQDAAAVLADMSFLPNPCLSVESSGNPYSVSADPPAEMTVNPDEPVYLPQTHSPEQHGPAADMEPVGDPIQSGVPPNECADTAACLESESTLLSTSQETRSIPVPEASQQLESCINRFTSASVNDDLESSGVPSESMQLQQHRDRQPEELDIVPGPDTAAKKSPNHTLKRKGNYRKYTQESLKDAYQAVQDGMPVLKAAKQYGVPESTLRDRVLGKFGLDQTKSGPKPLLSMDQESKLVKHVHAMSNAGFCMARGDVLDLAIDMCVSLGLKEPGQKLSSRWYGDFIKRWPDVVKHIIQKPQCVQVKDVDLSKTDLMDQYYKELAILMFKYGIVGNPHRMYMVGEVIMENMGLAGEANRNCMSVLGAGNAMGTAIPPYIVFPQAVLSSGMPEILHGSNPGTQVYFSKTGTPDLDVYKTYFEQHFLRYAQAGLNEDNYVLVLYDGHQANLSLTIGENAVNTSVVLFPLPPQPNLTVACFEDLKNGFKVDTDQYVFPNPELYARETVLCQLLCKSYLSAFSFAKLVLAFSTLSLYPVSEKAAAAAVTDIKQRLDLANENVLMSECSEPTQTCRSLSTASPPSASPPHDAAESDLAETPDGETARRVNAKRRAKTEAKSSFRLLGDVVPVAQKGRDLIQKKSKGKKGLSQKTFSKHKPNHTYCSVLATPTAKKEFEMYTQRPVDAGRCIQIPVHVLQQLACNDNINEACLQEGNLELPDGVTMTGSGSEPCTFQMFVSGGPSQSVFPAPSQPQQRQAPCDSMTGIHIAVVAGMPHSMQANPTNTNAGHNLGTLPHSSSSVMSQPQSRTLTAVPMVMAPQHHPGFHHTNPSNLSQTISSLTDAATIASEFPLSQSQIYSTQNSCLLRNLESKNQKPKTTKAPQLSVARVPASETFSSQFIPSLPFHSASPNLPPTHPAFPQPQTQASPESLLYNIQESNRPTDQDSSQILTTLTVDSTKS